MFAELARRHRVVGIVVGVCRPCRVIGISGFHCPGCGELRTDTVLYNLPNNKAELPGEKESLVETIQYLREEVDRLTKELRAMVRNAA